VNTTLPHELVRTRRAFGSDEVRGQSRPVRRRSHDPVAPFVASGQLNSVQPLIEWEPIQRLVEASVCVERVR
jgi:hypothetical protein